jgi:hypothetical protein
MTEPGSSPRAAARAHYLAAAAGDAALRAPDPEQPSLTERVQRLYEAGVVPVAEIASLAGVTERTIYKYVQKGGWRRRVPQLARGAGGRFVPVAEAGKPHPRGLKAVDPAGAAAASARCVRAGALAEEAAAAAETAQGEQARLRTLQALNRTLAQLAEIEGKDGPGADSEVARATRRAANVLLDQLAALQAAPHD